MSPRFTHTGKQVFDGTAHFADASTPESASLIVSLGNDQRPKATSFARVDTAKAFIASLPALTIQKITFKHIGSNRPEGQTK